MKNRNPLPPETSDIEDRWDDDEGLCEDFQPPEMRDLIHENRLRHVVDCIEHQLDRIDGHVEDFPQDQELLLGMLRDFLAEYEPVAQQRSLFGADA